MSKYEVGQTLHKVTSPSHHGGEPRHSSITITKIGRKWATYRENWGDEKFCMMDTDDHQEGVVYAGEHFSNDKVYLSRQHYDDEMSAADAMSELYSRLSRSPQKGVTFEDVKAASLLLKIELKGQGQ